MPKQSALKRTVRVWLAEHDKTQDWLAFKLEISNSHLSLILSGYRPLTDELANDLERLTGIDLREHVGAA